MKHLQNRYQEFVSCSVKTSFLLLYEKKIGIIDAVGTVSVRETWVSMYNFTLSVFCFMKYVHNISELSWDLCVYIMCRQVRKTIL